MKSLDALNSFLTSPKKIVITHHYNADADALGSSLGLFHYLNQKGHQCVVISPNSMADFLLWMPGAREVLLFDKHAEACKKAVSEADVIFSLDYNQFSRTKFLAPVLEQSNAVKVIIDHHLFPDDVFEYGLSLPDKSSTCEMVYDYILSSSGEHLLNLDIARCLYAGVMTDTGSFRFSCTTPGVHRMVARLMEKGLETATIHTAVFDNYQENRLRFLGFVLSERLHLIPETHTAIISVNRNDLNRFNVNTGDSEGIVNYPLSMKQVLFSIFISEREDEIRMSFRSKGRFNVNEFARKYFQGGGHHNAAGGKSERSLQQTFELLIQYIQENQLLLQSCYTESL